MKDYLVTGAAGFIGSKLLKKLKEKGFEADGIDNFKYSPKKNVLNRNIYKVDIVFKIELSKIIKNYRTIIHLAAVDDRKKFIKNFSESNNINILGTLNILDLLNPVNQLFFHPIWFMVKVQSSYLLKNIQPFVTNLILYQKFVVKA